MGQTVVATKKIVRQSGEEGGLVRGDLETCLPSYATKVAPAGSPAGRVALLCILDFLIFLDDRSPEGINYQ